MSMLSAAISPHWKSWLAFIIGLGATTLIRRTYALRLFVVLCALNWRNLPFVWHARCFLWLPTYRLQLALMSRGLLRPPKEAQGTKLGLKGIERALLGIGRSPFEHVQATDEFVSFGDADFNLHMSNSTYTAYGDYNRFQWAIATCGPVFAREHLTVALAETRYFFLREIPIFSSFQHEARIATWDNQWFFYYLRFLIPVSKRARANPSFVKVKDYEGRERVLASCAVARMCAKLPGQPRSLHPGRIFVLSGMGVDGTNWELAKELRRKRQAKKWIAEDGNPEGMLPFEETRIARLEALKGLTDKASWVALDALICGPSTSA